MMRLISQDGKIDSPYEQMIVNIDCMHPKQILASGCNCEKAGSLFLVAKYSTEAKTIKAMEMLRDAYAGKLICRNVDLTDGKVAEVMKKWHMEAIIVKKSDATRVDYINNTIFQFPKDEEVEE